MKVDLGTCAVCGAKNSKFVEACYKCGAALPWAPNYVAPQLQEVKPKPQDAPAPQPVATPKPQPQSVSQPQAPGTPGGTKSEAKTVVSPPLDLDRFKDDKTPLTDSMADRATRRVPVPTWAIGAGILGCIGLGMALVMIFGNRSPAPTTVAPPTLTPLPTSSSVTSRTPASITPAPGTSASVTPVPTLAATAIPTLLPTAAPVAISAPTSLPTPAATAVAVVASGPSFDSLYLSTTSGTLEQKNAYWKTVQNTKVSWRGDFVSLGTSASGPLKIRCKNGANSALVTVALSTTPPQTLAPMQPNQSITVEGILSGYSAQGYELTQGRVN